MLAQIQPFIAAEVAYRREHLIATFPRSTKYTAEKHERREHRRHFVPGAVRRAFAGH
jgi:hypothetical protein